LHGLGSEKRRRIVHENNLLMDYENTECVQDSGSNS